MFDSSSSAHEIATELAFNHKITWTECLALVVAAEAARRPTRVDMLLEGWALPPQEAPSAQQSLDALIDTLAEWGRQFWGTPREGALMVWFDEHVSGQREHSYPSFWGGASAREAFCLDLHPVHNPGDHTGLRQFSEERLLADVRILEKLPETKWMRARLQAIIAERQRRR